jgi:hypothetical protein
MDARAKIVEWLTSNCAVNRRTAITDETEIYYDLGIYGDDVYEFFVWLHDEFGVKFGKFRFKDYCRPEGSLSPFLFRSWRERYERQHRRYKSLTVGSILSAIELGQFPLN